MQRLEIEAGRVGAWVVKCDPDEVFDLVDPSSGMWDSVRLRPIDLDGEWSLGTTYRSGIIAPGDRCFFYVSGDASRSWPSGLWGECDILGVATDGRGGGPWIDLARRDAVVPYLPLRWRFFSRPVLKSAIRANPALSASELVLVPNMTNPVALRVVEANAIASIIPGPSRPGIVSSGRRPAQA